MCLSIAVTEPRYVLEQGVKDGYEWVITFNKLACRCGYIQISSKDHPWYGKDDRSPELAEVFVHGGVTFSKADSPCEKEGLDNGWWIGFDCSHAFDLADPELIDRFRNTDLILLSSFCLTFDGSNFGEVRSQEYVKENCFLLITQAIQAAKK